MMVKGKITMENGEIIPFELYEEDAPVTVANFVKLAKSGYYDGKTFHRVIRASSLRAAVPAAMGPGIWDIPSLARPMAIRTGMWQAPSRWHIAGVIQDAASSSSFIRRSRIWMGCIRYSVR